VPRTRIIRVRGNQRDHIDADLMAQLVVTLGRQLAQEAEASADQSAPPPISGPEANRSPGEAMA
jgi:hypothetical protein